MDEIQPDSLKGFAKIAFQCLKRSHEKRPRMEVIVEELEKCLKYQQFAHLRIPLADILSATNNFSNEHRIGGGGFGQVFEGKLSSMENTMVAVKVFDRSFGQGDDSEFWKEVMMLAEYKHGNIIPLLGFCDENSQKILVYRYASRKSLDTHIENKELTWSLRLKICIDAAKGLAYHNPGGTQQRLLHHNIKSSNILLDDNWNAIITDFGLSANQKNTFLITSSTASTVGYVDPQYIEDGVLTKESDVYSFGVVLFEVLCGRLCIINIDGNQSSLTSLVRDKDSQNKLHEIVWCNIKDEIHPTSLKIFSAIAYQCLNKESYERPSIEEIVLALETSLTCQVSCIFPLKSFSAEDVVLALRTKSTANKKSFFVKEFEHLRIQLDEVVLATNNFSKDHCIGGGGFGSVFEGKLILRGNNTRVAIKRLDRSSGQGDSEFWKEVMMLSEYKHENIITNLGFCDEKDEKILVYKFASKKSLDKHLDNKELTWIRCLRLCIGAASGLSYLHNPGGTQQRLLHRDIKSPNILLDDNWNARIPDFGFSKFGPANQKKTFLITNQIVGTLGYCDPQYLQDGVLTKESDVYSFGVVLFEVLCGRLCINDKHQSLTKFLRTHIKCNKLNEIVWCNIKDEIHPNTLKMFSKIAFQCLKPDHEKRPKMEEIVRALETCLQFQEAFDQAQETKLKQKALDLDFKEICPPGGSDLVILYTTSVKGIRKTSKDCFRVRSLLKSLKVSYQERDVSMHLDFRTELSQIFSGSVALPRLFIKGKYIGGAEEVFLLHEQGKFRPLLAGVPLNKSEGACKMCAGVRSVVCRKCNGNNFLKSGHGKQTRCTECNKNGLITCPDCF